MKGDAKEKKERQWRGGGEDLESWCVFTAAVEAVSATIASIKTGRQDTKAGRKVRRHEVFDLAGGTALPPDSLDFLGREGLRPVPRPSHLNFIRGFDPQTPHTENTGLTLKTNYF